MFRPLDNWKTIGIPFFFISPGAAVLGPICGFLATIAASANLLKFQASANATAVLLNYPLTVAAMIWLDNEPFYIALVVILWFNKILLSFCGSKVRQHLLNPAFIRNAAKIEDRFNMFVQAKQQADAGVRPGMNAEERAATLANAGPPGLAGESDDDDADEDDTSFGIIPKNKLRPDEDKREKMNIF